MILAVLLFLIVATAIVFVVPILVRLASPLFAPLKQRIYQAGLQSKASNSKTTRRGPDLLKFAFAVLTLLVLLFLFIPIGLVILHSFNSGGSFSIWAGSVSTKWWGTLFRADKTWALTALRDHPCDRCARPAGRQAGHRTIERVRRSVGGRVCLPGRAVRQWRHDGLVPRQFP